MNITDEKYNLAPRKWFDTDVGSDYGVLRNKTDDEYMEDYEKDFLMTSDNKTSL